MVKRLTRSAKVSRAAKAAQKSRTAPRKPVTRKPAAVKPASRTKTAVATKPRAIAKPVRKPVKSPAKSKLAGKPEQAGTKKPVVAKTPAGKAKQAPKKAARPVTKPVPAKAPASAARVRAARPAIKPTPMAATPMYNLKPGPSFKTSAPVRLTKLEHDGFKVNDHVVYPTHGVGKIVAVDEQEVAGHRLELFVIAFEQEKMTLRVPLGKAKAVGMRVLSSQDTVRAALRTLRGRARVKRTMWSRRAQEYEAKINSGDLMAIAEVVRDLHRAVGQPEQSYSERQIYESALERLLREVSAVEQLDGDSALKRIEGALLKAA